MSRRYKIFTVDEIFWIDSLIYCSNLHSMSPWWMWNHLFVPLVRRLTVSPKWLRGSRIFKFVPASLKLLCFISDHYCCSAVSQWNVSINKKGRFPESFIKLLQMVNAVSHWSIRMRCTVTKFFYAKVHFAFGPHAKLLFNFQ